ncbi:MAG TPA: histidine kinase dimerization/phospho-acceptor domain-containing protein, partial [Polyangiaceae bacterium]
MFSTFRAKLMLIVGTTMLALVTLIVGNWLIGQQGTRVLSNVESHLVPKLELGPRLDLHFGRLRQSLQDAVAAHDSEAVDATVENKDELLGLLTSSSSVVDARDAQAARRAVESYYVAARDVSRRLIQGEAGEALVNAVAEMQDRQQRAAELLKRVSNLNRADLAHGFAAARKSTESAARFQLLIGLSAFLLVLWLSLWVSRGVIRTLGQISEGFSRFATGNFELRIPVTAQDELGKVSENANQMADSLRKLAERRTRDDWLQSGLVGLSDELRGDLTPDEAARRAVAFLAHRVEAVGGALYLRDDDDILRLYGHYAMAVLAGDRPTASFRLGEALVGQAALATEIVVVDEPPPDYLRIRSGLGEGAPRAIVFLPLTRIGKVTGMIELALFRPCSASVREFLTLVREALSVTLEAATSRAAQRALLEQTREQARRLAAQEEELRVNNRELRAQQEELRQTNEELQVQRAALQQQNAQLEDARQRVQQNAEELAKVSSYKSQFLANMSHELRTPLNSILVLSQLLAENRPKTLTDEQVENCKTICSSGNDLLDLINQVLDLAKIEADKQDVHPVPVKLADLAEHARRMFAPMAEDKGLDFVTDIQPGSPEFITTDRQRVERILVNLLGNAVKFTERGEVALRIGRPEPDASLQR